MDGRVKGQRRTFYQSERRHSAGAAYDEPRAMHAPSGEERISSRPGLKSAALDDTGFFREGSIRIMHYENHKAAIEDLEARILTIRDSL